jgi:hypothetical protein
MRTIPLHGKIAAGRVALVDDADYDLVMVYRWNVKQIDRPRRRRPSGPYALAYMRGPVRVKHKVILMHTLITGWTQTDHIDHDGLNNQRANLRPATGSQNNANQRPQKGRSSRFKGVCWNRSCQKWQVYIHGRYLGVFLNEEDAARAYDAAAVAAWGEYACVNFPKEQS